MAGRWSLILLLVACAASVGFLLGCVWTHWMYLRKREDEAAERIEGKRPERAGARRALEDGRPARLEKLTR